MANKRNLKKEINYITDELFSECLFNRLYMPGSNKTKCDELMAKITHVQENLLSRVNHPDGKDNPKLVRKHYQKIIADLDQTINEIMGVLSEESK